MKQDKVKQQDYTPGAIVRHKLTRKRLLVIGNYLTRFDLRVRDEHMDILVVNVCEVELAHR